MHFSAHIDEQAGAGFAGSRDAAHDDDALAFITQNIASHCTLTFSFLVEKQIGRAHVFTPVTNAHLVCRLLLEKKNSHPNLNPTYICYTYPHTTYRAMII